MPSGVVNRWQKCSHTSALPDFNHKRVFLTILLVPAHEAIYTSELWSWYKVELCSRITQETSPAEIRILILGQSKVLIIWYLTLPAAKKVQVAELLGAYLCIREGELSADSLWEYLKLKRGEKFLAQPEALLMHPDENTVARVISMLKKFQVLLPLNSNCVLKKVKFVCVAEQQRYRHLS